MDVSGGLQTHWLEDHGRFQVKPAVFKRFFGAYPAGMLPKFKLPLINNEDLETARMRQ